MFKEQKGITLVALVVTIIVLLILAGVSISLVLGNNGVLTQASGAVTKTNVAKVKEDVDLALSSLQADYYIAMTTDSSISSKFYTVQKLSGYLTAGVILVDSHKAQISTTATPETDLATGTTYYVLYNGVYYEFKLTELGTTGTSTLAYEVDVTTVKTVQL